MLMWVEVRKTSRTNSLPDICSFFLFKLFITFLYNRLYIYKNTKKKTKEHIRTKKKNDEYCYRHIYEDNMPESYGQDLKTKKTSTATR